MPSRPPPIRTYARLNKGQQLKLCIHHRDNPKLTQQELAEWATFTFKLRSWLGVSTVSRTLRLAGLLAGLSPDELKFKTLRNPVRRKFDADLRDWVLTQEKRQNIVNGAAIKKEAKRLLDQNSYVHNGQPLTPLKFSNGWLSCFQRRHDFTWKKFHGEALSVDPALVAAERTKLQQITAQYAPRDTYNFDETGFMYNWVPSRSICRTRRNGVKQSKDRITVALCANMDASDKRPALYIGKSAQPRAFGKQKAADFGLQYCNTKKAWMSTELFCEWVHSFDKEMRESARHVLLLVDNAPVHPESLRLQLTNTRLHFFEPNMTSHIQPLDQGVIANAKHFARDKLTQRYVDSIAATGNRPGRLNVLQAMQVFDAAWSHVKPSTISNSWKRAGIVEFHDDFGGQLGFLVHNLSLAPDLELAPYSMAEFLLDGTPDVDISMAPSHSDLLDPAALDLFLDELVDPLMFPTFP